MKLIAAVLVAIIVCMLPGAAQAQCSGQFAPGTLCGNATGSLAPPRSVAAGAFGFITVTVVQGDLVYGSASGELSALPKDTNATRYLSNAGTSNNPAWAQVSLTSGVTGNLPLANIAQSAANTMLGNWTGSTANVAANAMISCPDTGGNHLNYVSGTGITCGTSGGASGITTLTGDVTASGSGSVAATLATVASAGTTGSSTAIPVITINAKGLTTSITTAAVVAPAGTLTGATLAANVLASSLTSVGTLTGGATGSGFTINIGTSTVSGNLPVANLGSGGGTPSSSTFLRGDNQWATPAGSGNVTTSVTLTANRLVLGNGTTDLVVLASLGTTATLLHGNAAGAPTFGSVVSADLNITPTPCTNQFVTAISAAAAGTCSTATLASAQFANQGTTITVLHGNGAGNPAFSSVVSADLNLTTTACSAGTFVVSISAGGVGTCSAPVAAIVITSSANPCLAVGPSGNTSPMFRVVCDTASAVTGVQITGAAAGAGVAVAAISSVAQTNESLTLDAKGSGTLTLNNTATGSIFMGRQVRANVSNTTNPGYAGVGNLAGIDVGTTNVVNIVTNSVTRLQATNTAITATQTIYGIDTTTNLAFSFAGDTDTGIANPAANRIDTYNQGVNTGRFLCSTVASTICTAGAFSTFVPAVIQPQQTIASASNMNWNDIEVSPLTTTITGTTTISAVARVAIFSGTLAQTGAGTVTVSLAEGLYVEPPTAGTDVTITDAFAARFAGNVYLNAGSYINFTSVSGDRASSGCGFRDNSGTMQVANCSSPGSWSNFSAGSTTGAPYVGGSLGGVITASVTTYVGPGDGAQSNSASTTEGDHQVSVTRAGTAKLFTIVTRAANSGTGALVATVRKNGVDTGIVITISAGAAAGAFAESSPTTASFASHDLLSIKLANGASAAGPSLNFSLQYDFLFFVVGWRRRRHSNDNDFDVRRAA